MIDLIVEDPDWDRALPDLADVAARAAQVALAGAGLDPAGYQIALLACDDARISALNADFRGRPAPTNVLSWPAFHLSPDSPGNRPPPPPRPGPGDDLPLGDVAIALQTCEEEAKSAEIPLKNHVTHLILHGCLHLLGYDHQTEEDAVIMEGIESRGLTGIGIADPYV